MRGIWLTDPEADGPWMCGCRQEGSKELPQMSWSKIDLRQLAQQKQHMNAGMTHQGGNSQRTLRKMDASKRKKGNK